jgi:hypothetical protein
MGQNPSKTTSHSHHGIGHHRGRDSASGGSHHNQQSSQSNTSTPVSSISASSTPTTGQQRAVSVSKKEGRNPTSRAMAVPPSETLVSATAQVTPQRQQGQPVRPSGVIGGGVTSGASGSPGFAGSTSPRAMPDRRLVSGEIAAAVARPLKSPSPASHTQSPARQQSTSPAGSLPLQETHPRSLPISVGARMTSQSPPPLDERPSQTYGFEAYRAAGTPGVQRPPRLPLPIEQEYHDPGSPILSPTDLKGAIPDSELVDDDEPLSEMGMYQIDSGGATTVPTVIEWKGPGEEVFVTGTFAGWSKKFRLRPT